MTAAAVPSSSAPVLDAVVVGGGLAGLACGIALASGGLEVVIVDREEPAATLDAGFDGRTSAIAWGARRVLDGIGVWAAGNWYCLGLADSLPRSSLRVGLIHYNTAPEVDRLLDELAAFA